MKRIGWMIVTVLWILGMVSCKNEGDLPQKGECTPAGVVVNLKAKPEVAPVVDLAVAALCQSLGLEIKTLAQFNQVMSVLLSQTLASKVKSLEFISETEIAVTLVDGTRGVGQYRLKENVITWAVPSEVTGLPIAVPLQLGCVMQTGQVSFVVNKEMLDALIESPLFEVVMVLLENPLGGKITADAVRQLAGMMDEVMVSASFKTH